MKIKICGITSSTEAACLNKNQVDFCGMVLFFPKSKRNISLSTAKTILSTLEPSIHSVAVVVSPSLSQIKEIEDTGFHYIQIHGDLPADVEIHCHLPILKAFNTTDMSSFDVYHKCPFIAGYVFDAVTPGSGQVFDWSVLQNIPRDNKLFLLAGGLNPDNVKQAILAVKPDGVDVSSGVEYKDKPGKDPAAIDAFVANVRKGL